MGECRSVYQGWRLRQGLRQAFQAGTALSNDREQRIRNAINSSLAPSELIIKDQSHLHAGHVGARDGKGHFDLVIVSEQFVGAGRLERHRMVYDALSQLLQTDIHAVRIRALTAAENRPDNHGTHNI